MTNHLADDIIADMKRQAPNPQVHVLVLANNDFNFFKFQIINFLAEAREIEKCRIIVASILPSIENEKEYEEPLFVEFNMKESKSDQALKHESCFRHLLDPQFELLDLSKLFRTKAGKIKCFFYQKDGDHLNVDGTQVLAKKILNNVARLPKRFFQ